MQVSRFVVVFENVGKDKNVLYNVLSDAWANVNDDALDMVRRCDTGVPPRNEDEAEVARELAAHSFLVEDPEVDDRRLREHLERTAQGVPGTLYATLMHTVVGNVVWTCCRQNGSPEFDGMTAKTVEEALEFILGKAGEAATPKLVVRYFLREPTTSKGFVLRTAAVLSACMAARGVTFAWEVVTNGVLLDRPFVEMLSHFGEGSIQIARDGGMGTHDEVRVFCNGKGSFDAIFKHLVDAAGTGRLRIGGDFFLDQEESYAQFVQRLDERDDALDKARVLAKLDIMVPMYAHGLLSGRGRCAGRAPGWCAH